MKNKASKTNTTIVVAKIGLISALLVALITVFGSQLFKSKPVEVAPENTESIRNIEVNTNSDSTKVHSQKIINPEPNKNKLPNHIKNSVTIVNDNKGVIIQGDSVTINDITVNEK